MVTRFRSVAASMAALMLLASAGPVFAQNAPAPGGLPPLIDRELFFGDPEIAAPRLSPDGAFIAFLRPYQGMRNIWVKRTNEPFDAARPVTADTTRPIPDYAWSRDGRFILYVQDEGGDENYNLHVVDPAAAPAAGRNVPPARNLTAVKGVRVVMYAMPRDEPDTIYIGLNDRDPAWHDLYRVSLSSGARTLMRQNTDRIGAGSSIWPGSCAWPFARPRTAIPSCCASTRIASRRSTSAASSSRAARSGSTRTAPASTW
jgi:dipeptidyl aminopeptidase/acylaminoacyl peptidase